MSPTKHEQMRNLNTLSVLDFIRQHGQSTRRDIQTATGLSWAAVSTISTDLIAKNILKESAYHGHLAGRNPAYLNFSPMRNLTIGMELNAEGLTVLLLGLRCEVIDSRIEAIRSLERDDVLRQMLGAVEAIRGSCSASASPCRAPWIAKAPPRCITPSSVTGKTYR